MKRMKYILNGFLALAMVLLFAQCSNNQSTPSQAVTPAATGGSTNMKIAYVEIDSLLTKYRFWNDLNELMIQKEENIRTTLNEKAKELDREMREFQRKLENNGFATRERAEQENLRLSQKQRDLQQLQEKLAADLQTENQKNSLQLRDSINSFLKIYNKTKGYSLIISNTGFDNLLYADTAYNITQEIVEGLNAAVCRYCLQHYSGNCRRLECSLQPKFCKKIICFYNLLKRLLHVTCGAVFFRLECQATCSFPDLLLINLCPVYNFIYELIGFQTSKIPVLTDRILIILLMTLQ